ncbi:MAG: urate hydroxylase PuuD, partial [Gammaproteobacteria bacterium]|nr:urate hydroxylase PuuD [Gammaproteobacteria bacterium]
MELDLLAWVQLAVRWFHLVAGIAWIGASFHFIWLDNALEKPKSPAPGVGGEAWLVHGGGFYHNQKYLVAPARLPEHLHWFKWEAYSTWLSGFALLILIYYLGAEIYLVDPGRAALTGWQATAVGVGALIAGWLAYDGLCRSPLKDNAPAVALFWFVIMTLAAWGLTRVLSDRGAVIHVGAMLGTVMVGNVFLVIIPNQRKAVAAMARGEAPDAELGLQAKQRSLHNNYMTLPVLFMMIANHFPMVVGHDYNWAILAGLSAISILIRHFFNLKHRGRLHWELIGWAAAG